MIEKEAEALNSNLDHIFSCNAQSYNDKLQELKQENADRYCLWHKKGFPGHHNNFGLMGECKDCLAEIEKGRCSVDVCNFDMDIYWTVRNFWLKVDVKGPNECWKWLGGTKKNGQETVAYMPSPFHSAKTQSASRVAFWLSRGYTGRYRIFHQEGCDITCCNPLHLRIKELTLTSQPTEIKTVNLSYGNIFEHAKASIEKKSSYFE